MSTFDDLPDGLRQSCERLARLHAELRFGTPEQQRAAETELTRERVPDGACYPSATAAVIEAARTVIDSAYWPVYVDGKPMGPAQVSEVAMRLLREALAALDGKEVA